mgnify:CR=1 FL=1
MQKDHIGNDVRILSHQIHRWIENAPNKKKIDSVTGANAWIIGYISDKTDNNEDVFQKDLESCFEITRSTASKVVNLMVAKRTDRAAERAVGCASEKAGFNRSGKRSE